MSKREDEYRGKWKVVELTHHTIEANGLTYDEAVREANRLARSDSTGSNGEAEHQYDVEPSRKRKY